MFVISYGLSWSRLSDDNLVQARADQLDRARAPVEEVLLPLYPLPLATPHPPHPMPGGAGGGGIRNGTGIEQPGGLTHQRRQS